MKPGAMCVAAAFGAALAVAGCGPTRGDGGSGVEMGVSVEGLQENQYFCFTWQVYQQDSAGWIVVDQMLEPTCAEPGADTSYSYASCVGGERFIVAYEVAYYDESGMLGSATGVSGGGADDVCVKNADAKTSVLFQFRNEGNAGGADLYVNIDQVCTNDKALVDNGRAISAVWVQPDGCGEGDPDGYCVLGTGCFDGIQTVRTGITADGRTRFVFSESQPLSQWELFYLFFEPSVAPDALILQHSPYVLDHENRYGTVERGSIPASVAFRYDESGGNVAVGFIQLKPCESRHDDDDDDCPYLEIVYDLTGTCNGGVELGASTQMLEPECEDEGDVELVGALPAGGSAFTLVLQCAGAFEFVLCDARGMAGGICQDGDDDDDDDDEDDDEEDDD